MEKFSLVDRRAPAPRVGKTCSSRVWYKKRDSLLFLAAYTLIGLVGQKTMLVWLASLLYMTHGQEQFSYSHLVGGLNIRLHRV
jgi:hypothetical protein